MTSVTINGIHDVAAPDPCHIVDLTIRDATTACERLKGIVFEVVVEHRATKQAPFGEHYLSVPDGTILGDFYMVGIIQRFGLPTSALHS